jgi:hypothetical protein
MANTPTVDTITVVFVPIIEATSATLGGNVTDDGGFALTGRVCPAVASDESSKQ